MALQDKIGRKEIVDKVCWLVDSLKKGLLSHSRISLRMPAKKKIKRLHMSPSMLVTLFYNEC